jgi:hypothetical protein
MATVWLQGEHIALIAQTGTGKTTLASKILSIRSYPVVLAVKRRDESLLLFEQEGYKTISKWPPERAFHKIVLWFKPDSLSDDLAAQAKRIHRAFNDMYLAGGYAIYLDEVGYLSGTLRLGRDIGVLMSQGRSNNLSIIAGMQRPSSVVANVPKETFTQARHILIGKYTDELEQETSARIAGITRQNMLYYQENLLQYAGGNTDFIYVGKHHIFIVTP